MRNIRKSIIRTRRNSDWFELNRYKETPKNEQEPKPTR